MLNITICDDEQRILVELKKQIESILGEKEKKNFVFEKKVVPLHR